MDTNSTSDSNKQKKDTQPSASFSLCALYQCISDLLEYFLFKSKKSQPSPTTRNLDQGSQTDKVTILDENELLTLSNNMAKWGT